jgi:hypothetical protein
MVVDDAEFYDEKGSSSSKQTLHSTRFFPGFSLILSLLGC